MRRGCTLFITTTTQHGIRTTSSNIILFIYQQCATTYDNTFANFLQQWWWWLFFACPPANNHLSISLSLSQYKLLQTHKHLTFTNRKHWHLNHLYTWTQLVESLFPNIHAFINSPDTHNFPTSYRPTFNLIPITYSENNCSDDIACWKCCNNISFANAAENSGPRGRGQKIGNTWSKKEKHSKNRNVLLHGIELINWLHFSIKWPADQQEE